MLFECPQCGKVIEMTLEELALSKKVVVCPQCLNEFLAQGVDIPASVLHPSRQASKARQLYCHSCGESLPVEGLKFCPYCGASQNLMGIEHAESRQEALANTVVQAMGDEALKTNEDKIVVEDDAYDMMSHLPLIRPLPRIRSKREVMGSPLTRAICYVIIFVLIAIFFFILYLANFDEDGKVARAIGFNF